MTVSKKNAIPDFFNESSLDPVSAATGFNGKKSAVKKKKAGFYLSEEVLLRFNRKFHQMKLEGIPIENKSALAELAFDFALKDLEKENNSRILNRIINKSA